MIYFEFDKKQLKDMQKKFKQFDGLPLRFLRDLTNEAETQMVNFLRSGGLLKVRTGRLWQSIQGYADPQTLVGVVGSGARIKAQRVKYASIHATGGIIKAKPGKYLAIPLPSILQGSRGMIKGNEMRPRDFKDTFFYRSRQGNLLLAQRTGSGMRNLFVMKRQVRIPKRDYITATANIMQSKYFSIFQNSLEKVSK